MKTAYIELNTTNQIHSLSSTGSKNPFTYLGISMYPSMKVTSLSMVLSKDYDYIILDMGVLTNYTALEFAKCDKQFLVCNLCEWKKQISLEKIQDLFQKTNLNSKNVTILNNINKSIGLPSFSYGITKIQNFPFLSNSNPFQLSTNTFSDFEHLLERSQFFI